ncbi:MAG: hypothetical protein FWD23_13295 [Oscillospiraceae bacterium]|nr:hypothetical protein [Oscillospiraceae bacterium]
MKKTIIIFILLTVSAIIFSGCGSAENGGGSGNTSENAADTTDLPVWETETPASEERIPAGLPDADYGGYEFKILSRGPNYNVHWFARDIYAESETGEPINDAVYSRNRAVEESYNIKIANFPEDGDPAARALKSVKAGSDDFDIVSHGMAQMASLMVGGALFDLHTFPHIDLSKPWWDQKASEQLTLKGKLYATVGDYIILDKDATVAVLFSKKLVNDYELDDPYQAVRDGTWTMDKMFGMMKAVAKDLNGDGMMDESDQWGLVSQYGNGMPFFNGAGEYIAKINSSGLPEIAFYSQRAFEICDKIIDLQANKNITIHAEDYISKYPNDTVWDEMQLVVFNTNRGLFYCAGLNRVTLLRSMEIDFGILPLPKFDEEQSSYYALLESWCTSSVSIPVTVADTARTGVITEALAAESRYTVLPAYYDITLKSKLVRDDESQEILDLIFANRLYDIGQLFGWGNANSFFHALYSGNNTLASFWEKNEAKIEKEMQKTLDALDKLD